MDTIATTRLSKFLSQHLRHQPEAIGLTLAPAAGWPWPTCWPPAPPTATPHPRRAGRPSGR
ncbi:MAG: hypothetical protein WKG07_34925 [Hymenobacter sp.]